jgi:hypothetical protein
VPRAQSEPTNEAHPTHRANRASDDDNDDLLTDVVQLVGQRQPAQPAEKTIPPQRYVDLSTYPITIIARITALTSALTLALAKDATMRAIRDVEMKSHVVPRDEKESGLNRSQSLRPTTSARLTQ